MAWMEWTFTLLMFLATVRALTTALRKESEGHTNGGLTENDRLYLREDIEHWWMSVVINGMLLSAGAVALFAPNEPDPAVTIVDLYITYCFLALALLLNVRIERHGYYYRRRVGVNFWGKPREGFQREESARDVMEEVRDDVHEMQRQSLEDRPAEETDRREGHDHRYPKGH
jgi:hypothetical protein